MKVLIILAVFIIVMLTIFLCVRFTMGKQKTNNQGSSSHAGGYSGDRDGDSRNGDRQEQQPEDKEVVEE